MLDNLLENQKKMFQMWQDFFKKTTEAKPLEKTLPAEFVNPFFKMDKSTEVFKDFYSFFQNFQKNFSSPENFYNFSDFQNLFLKFQNEYSNIILKIFGVSDITPAKIFENFTRNLMLNNAYTPLLQFFQKPDFDISKYNAGTFEEFLKMPSFWLTREFDELVKNVVNDFFEYLKKVEEFRKILNEQSKKAFEKFLEEFKKQPTFEDFDKFFKKWVETNENIFQEFFKSDEYGQILRNLLKAGSKFKISLDKYTQQVLKESNIATKYELDRAYKEIYKLKKEIKLLKEKLLELEKDRRAEGGNK